MWENYKQIRFLAEVPTPDWPCFAIITAWNPASQPLTRTENELRHQALLARLCDYPHLGVWGSAPDLGWQEFSLAVACPLSVAMGLAAEHGQNAIYWIEGGCLSLIPVLLAEEAVVLGALAPYWIAPGATR